MKPADKARRIGKILDEIYPSPEVSLHNRDPFSLLVATVLSAQTTDKKVNQVTPALFARAATAAEMASLRVREIETIIHTVGLAPTKARNIKALSGKLLCDYAGQVPAEMRALESLPGVGHKTASVVLAQAFGIPSFPVDTHIHRLAARWGLSSGRNVAQTERDLKHLFPRERWNKLHLQMIFFGREFCPARGHDLSQCPICSWAAPKLNSRKQIRFVATVARERTRG
ncbi:MAG: endonuclease III [Deltaproteobacteria bacterium]|nr:endonuclease III [Deltaproteobacteria bacterium]